MRAIARHRVPLRALHHSARLWAKPDAGAPEVNGKKLSPEEAKVEAIKLAQKSLKDMASLFSSGSDDASQPINTEPIYENPKLYGGLSLLHQGQVDAELQEKYDKKWTKLTEKDKKLGYYISYGDWGVREKFHNWNLQEPPLDLPFHVPSKIRTTNPKPTDKVNKLEPVFLAETPVRREQFDTSKMDGITKSFIYFTLFVIVFALARDKKTGEEGKPVEYVVPDLYLERKEKKEQELEKQRLEELRLQESKKPKWYYLWLR